MAFLPIAERELRAAAHHPRSWWRRVLVAGAAVVLLAFVFVSMLGWQQPSTRLGRESFMVLSAALMVYALLTGPMATVDALSRERREGTLGLLFLTPLHSYDVVLGKMVAASLETLLGLASTMPILAIPFLMGGVSLAQFFAAALCVAVLAFFSLAAGICASAVSISGRAALAATIIFLAGLTLGLPVVGEEALGIRLGSGWAPYFYMVCPLYSMELALDRLGRGGGAGWFEFWLNMAALSGLAGALIMVAINRTARAWRERSESHVMGRLRAVLRRIGAFSAYGKQRWRNRALELNPVYWLEGREVLQRRLAWATVIITTGFWVFAHLDHPRSWPDQDLVILWPMFGHYILCMWVAVDAPRRLADDKQSGALELMLCAPVPPGRIVAGNMMALWRRFAGPLFMLMALSCYSLMAYLWFHQPNLPWRKDLLWLAAFGAAVMPVQAYSFARVGLYLGLAQATSLRATFMLVWVLGLLPWLLFMGFIFTMEFVPRLLGVFRPMFLPFIGRLQFEHIVGAWAMLHLLVCTWFLRLANRNLRWNFRKLAAQGPAKWWRIMFGL